MFSQGFFGLFAVAPGCLGVLPKIESLGFRVAGFSFFLLKGFRVSCSTL